MDVDDSVISTPWSLFPIVRQHGPAPVSAVLRAQIGLLLEPCAVDAKKEEMVRCK